MADTLAQRYDDSDRSRRAGQPDDGVAGPFDGARPSATAA